MREKEPYISEENTWHMSDANKIKNSSVAYSMETQFLSDLCLLAASNYLNNDVL